MLEYKAMVNIFGLDAKFNAKVDEIISMIDSYTYGDDETFNEISKSVLEFYEEYNSNLLAKK